LGDIRLQELTANEIETFYANKHKIGLSGTTVLYIHRVFKHALRDAVIKELIPKNPVEYIKAPKKCVYKRLLFGR
jgi:hypothetical protein